MSSSIHNCSSATNCISLSAISSWPRPIVSHSSNVSGSTSAIFSSYCPKTQIKWKKNNIKRNQRTTLLKHRGIFPAPHDVYCGESKDSICSIVGTRRKRNYAEANKKRGHTPCLVSHSHNSSNRYCRFVYFFLLKPMKKCNEDERIKSNVPRVLRSGSEKEYEYTIPTISIEKISFIETRKDFGKWDSWWDSYQWTIYMADDLDDGIVSGRGCYWSLVIDGWR